MVSESTATPSHRMFHMKSQRKKRLIEPRLQLLFGALFTCTAILAILVQAIVLSYLLTKVARELPNDGLLLHRQHAGIVSTAMMATFLLLTPLTLAVGVVTTFRIVGPLYRFRVFLREDAALWYHVPNVGYRPLVHCLFVIIGQQAERQHECCNPGETDDK